MEASETIRRVDLTVGVAVVVLSLAMEEVVKRVGVFSSLTFSSVIEDGEKSRGSLSTSA